MLTSKEKQFGELLKLFGQFDPRYKYFNNKPSKSQACDLS